jgi:hypothetical protein
MGDLCWDGGRKMVVVGDGMGGDMWGDGSDGMGTGVCGLRDERQDGKYFTVAGWILGFWARLDIVLRYKSRSYEEE